MVSFVELPCLISLEIPFSQKSLSLGRQEKTLPPITSPPSPEPVVRLPSLVRKMESRGVSIVTAEELPPSPIFSPIKKKKRVTVAKSNTKEFKGLVALINHSSKSSNSAAGTVNVLKKWEELSRI